MFKIKCPSCQSEGSMSLVDASYSGPYRCWKCRALFTVEIKNEQVLSFKNLSEDELKKMQDMQKLQDKYKKDQDAG